MCLSHNLKQGDAEKKTVCSLCHCDMDASSKRESGIKRHMSSEKNECSREAAAASALALFVWQAAPPKDENICCRIQ